MGTSAATQMIRAVPMRRPSRPAVRPPRTPPTAASEKSAPTTSVEACRMRTRKTISTAAVPELKKFAVPVHATILRRIG